MTPRGVCVHLAYLDDSASDAKNRLTIFGGIVVEHQAFETLERQVGFTALRLLTADRVESLGEFHADDLFAGTGEFKDIPEAERREALRGLLSLPRKLNAPYFYSAVDKPSLQKAALGSAHPVDVGFRMCAMAIDHWLVNGYTIQMMAAGVDTIRKATIERPLCLLIADDCNDNIKGRLRKSYRELRRHMRLTEDSVGRITFAHDAMYFGDSVDSVGIQVADVCNYVMLRRIRDGIEDEFYKLLEPQVRCAKVEPDWSRDQFVFRSHEPTAASSASALEA